MGRSVRLELHDDGIIELLKSPGVTAHLQSLGSRVQSAMAATAPEKSGQLAASHRVETVEHPTRNVVQIGSDLDYAVPIAVATGYMARALDAAGGG